MSRKLIYAACLLTAVTLILTLFLSLGTRAMSVTQRSTPSRNLVSNASFEIKTDAPVDMPETWQPNAWGSGWCTLKRSGSEAYSGAWSGEINCTAEDDARWVQTIPVLPYRDYVLSGWIKTKDVQPSSQGSAPGANLSLLDTWLHTTPLLGTNDWTYVHLDFNTEDSREVTVAARLGFYGGVTAGSAWFDDIQLTLADSSDIRRVYLPTIHHSTTPPLYAWKTLVLIYRQTDVTFVRGGQQYHLQTQMTDADIVQIWRMVEKFEHTVQDWSGGHAYVLPKIVFPSRPIETLSGTEGNYWVAPEDTKPEIDAYAPLGTFDTIFVLWRRDNDSGTVEIPAPFGVAVIGSFCGSNGAGYSSIYAPRPHSGPWGGLHPEEVFVHEWTHLTTDFYYRHYDAPMPDIDAPAQYGYVPDDYGGWQTFLSDVMQGQVWYKDQYIGITPALWQTATPTWPYTHECTSSVYRTRRVIEDPHILQGGVEE